MVGFLKAPTLPTSSLNIFIVICNNTNKTRFNNKYLNHKLVCNLLQPSLLMCTHKCVHIRHGSQPSVGRVPQPRVLENPHINKAPSLRDRTTYIFFHMRADLSTYDLICQFPSKDSSIFQKPVKNLAVVSTLQTQQNFVSVTHLYGMVAGESNGYPLPTCYR